MFSAKVKNPETMTRQKTRKKQYTNTGEIKNDTPIKSVWAPGTNPRFMGVIKTIGFSRPDLNVKWAPFIRKCFRSCNLMIYREKSVHTPVFLTFKTPT